MHSTNNGLEAGSNSSAVLDAYLAEVAKGLTHRKKVAIRLWNTLDPSERLIRQRAAESIAGRDLELSAAYTQSALLLEYVISQQTMAGQKLRTPVALFEIVAEDPMISDGVASDLQPEA